MIARTWVLLFLVGVGCGAPLSRRPDQIHGIAEGVAADAWQLLRSDQPLAALRSARALDRLDPDRKLEAQLRAELPDESLQRAELPGAWKGLREPIERPLWEHVALWLPDRLFDILDLVSFELVVGVGLRIDAHLTQFAPFQLGASRGVGLGWHAERSFGLALHERSNFLGDTRHVRYLALHGTRSGLIASDISPDFPSSDDPYYSDLGDYWSVGVGAHALLLGATADIHPVQVWDLLAGIVGFDPWDDDSARTRPFNPKQQVRLRLEALHEVLLDLEGRKAYLEWLKQRAANQEGG